MKNIPVPSQKFLSSESYIETYIRPNGTKGIRTMNNDVSKSDPTGVEQSEIRSIMSEFSRTGRLPLRNGAPGIYSPDEVVPNGKDLLSATLLIQEASDRFMELPSTLRERFGNDPIQLHTFLSNPKNKDEAIKLGLLQSPPQNDELNDESGGKNKRTTKQPESSKKPDSKNQTDPE